MITEYQKLSKEIKNMNEEIVELKRNLYEIKEVTEKIIKEMNVFAKKESVKVLEKYINLWNPVKFITEEDVRKILRGELKSITSPHSNEP
jgi:predicted transcriptional regulator